MTSAKLYIQRSDWDNAIRNLDAELAKNPNNEEAWYLLGRVKGEKADFAGMNDAFGHALKIGQTHAKEIHDVRYNYWGKYLNIGVESFNKAKDSARYFDKAIAAFQTAIVINPDSAMAYKNLAFCYLANNQTSEALGMFEKSFAMSNDPASGRYIGEINYQMGASHKDKFEAPENKTEIKIWMTPAEVKAILGEPTSKSTTKDKKTKREKWVYADKKLTLDFEDDQLRAWQENGKKGEREPWVTYKDSTERDSAMKYFDTAITYLDSTMKIVQQRLDSRPDKNLKVGLSEQEVRSLMGAPKSVDTANTEYGQVDRWTYDGLKMYLYFQAGSLKGWQAYERNPDEQLLADLIGDLSNAYIAADKGETALELFKKGVETSPNNKFFHYNYGVLLLKAEQFEEALNQFRAAITLDSTYEAALYNLGVGYINWGVHIRESSSDPAKAEAAYKEKFKLALPYLEQMTKLKPDDPESWELLGRVYANLGKSKEATEVFEKADMLRKKK